MADSKGGKPRAKSELAAVSKVLQTLLANGKSPLSDQFLRWKLWRFWPTVVGETLGRSCEPVGFDRGRLYIWVKSSARLQEIRFFEDVLRQKVNAYLGRAWARELRFTTDRRGIPREAEATPEFKNYIANAEDTET